MTEIPSNATIRQEYVKCGNPDCQNQHGPYLYAYWKQDTKLNKRYIGKNLEDFRLRQIAKEIKLKPSLLIKFKFTEQQASKGNASWLENFYDLIVAIVVFQLSSILNHNVSVSGFLAFIALFVPVFCHGSELPSIIQGLKLMI